MIYLSDDYVSKYMDVMSYLIGRSYHDGYSFDYIEKTISYSLLINELEKSNITLIAFTSVEKLYSDIFSNSVNDYVFDVYNIFGWVGYSYINLFLSLNITFEVLFSIISIKEMLNLYNLYHEMDFVHLLNHAKEQMRHSLIDVFMKRKKISNKSLSEKTQIPVSTINALRYGNRDISKLEADKLLKLSQILKVKMESLLPDIHLNKQ